MPVVLEVLLERPEVRGDLVVVVVGGLDQGRAPQARAEAVPLEQLDDHVGVAGAPPQVRRHRAPLDRRTEPPDLDAALGDPRFQRRDLVAEGLEARHRLGEALGRGVGLGSGRVDPRLCLGDACSVPPPPAWSSSSPGRPRVAVAARHAATAAARAMPIRRRRTRFDWGTPTSWVHCPSRDRFTGCGLGVSPDDNGGSAARLLGGRP